mgnify:CR=1 FL=1
MNKNLLKSRKFWAAVSGLVIVVGNAALGKDAPFTAEQVTGVIVMLASYIFGVAIEDAGAKAGGQKTE